MKYGLWKYIKYRIWKSGIDLLNRYYIGLINESFNIKSYEFKYQLLKSDINIINNDPIVTLYYHSFGKSLFIYNKNKIIGNYSS